MQGFTALTEKQMVSADYDLHSFGLMHALNPEVRNMDFLQ